MFYKNDSTAAIIVCEKHRTGNYGLYETQNGDCSSESDVSLLPPNFKTILFNTKKGGKKYDKHNKKM